MALSGSFTTTAYSNRSLTFSWSATQSISGNYSTISWSLKGSGSQSQYFKAAPFTVVIDGEQVYHSETRIQLYNGTTVASGTKTIYHNANGSRSFSASVSAAIYTYAVNCSGSGSWDLTSIPRAATLSSATNFTDESNPSITYSNPAGTAATTLQAYIYASDDKTILIDGKNLNKSGTSFTFSLTDAERESLRKSTNTTNSRTVKFYVKTVIGSNTFWSSAIDKTFSIVNATPTFTSSVKDTGGSSTALTGNNQVMIRGFNYMNVSMEATAYKGATIKSYKITNGSNVIEAASGGFNNSESNVFKFEVWDSRGNTNSYTATLDMIPYVPLTTNVDGKILLSTDDSTKANVSFTIGGNYYNGSFGAVANTLALDYTLADEEGNTIATDVVEATLQENTYSIEVNIDDLDYRKSYIVYVAAADKIKSIPAQSKTLKATPIFDWGENDFNFNVPVTIQGVTLLDIFYPIGSIFQSTEYFNPSEKMGGEWEQLTDRFLLGAGDTYQAGTTGGSATNTHNHYTASSFDGANFFAGFCSNVPRSRVVTKNRVTWAGSGATTSTREDSTYDESISIMPPYLVVYMWQRVA